MKHTLIVILTLTLFAASCGNAKKDGDGTLNDQKAQLQKLKEDQKKLNDEIAKVEAEIKKA
ncbi:MAG: hypothetical protein V4676_09865, partial [Bacteroidota bacterium]